MSIPQIRTEAIEAVGRKILMEYDPSLLSGQPCPVPIETIIETKFDLILEFHTLRKNPKILGETIFDDGAVVLYDQIQRQYRMIAVRAGTILIDERLCDPSKLGRLRFTCAHELAHWVLHKKLYSGTGDVAAYNGNVSSDESHGIIERQADTLASALLMPLPQIKKCFYRLKIGRTDEQLIAEMANIFEVSKQAIVKRKSKYSVVYDYTDENGKRRQRWETFSTNAEAKKRKKQIEYEQDSGTFFIPTAKTLNDLLDEYMSIYGVNTWAMSTYESRRGLARNYITPIIGDMLLSDITPRMMDKYYRDLLSVKTVSVNNRKPTSEYLTPHTVREIHKLLRSAFNQAVRWELISRNPVLNATLPKEEHKERDIWTAETLSKAMEVCDDPILSLALNLAFSCSLRIGEMLGLTWDCIDIAPQSIENGSAYIFVNKELQRVTRGALDDLSDKGVIKKFPPCIASTHTALVLKEPKTKTSIRRVYLPKTVAYMLVERKKEIDELMDLFGDEYIDNNLVFCSSNGRPMESQVINRAFNKLIKENGLPHVVFHSLRHSSITYKLKLNGGDMKSVQGDSGHAQVKMVADVYSHIIDEDRCINAQRLEEAFYSSKTPDPVEDTEPKTADTAVTERDESDAAKILELLKNPETAALLKQLAKAL